MKCLSFITPINFRSSFDQAFCHSWSLIFYSYVNNFKNTHPIFVVVKEEVSK